MTTVTQRRKFYRRKLPHWQPSGAICFITYRLFGSLPASVIVEIRDSEKRLQIEIAELPEHLRAPAADKHRRWLFGQFDHALHSDIHCTNVRHLEHADAAEVVVAKLEQGAREKQYVLHRYCVMPNHVHTLLVPLPLNLPDSIPLQSGWPAFLERRTLCYDPSRELEYWGLENILRILKGSSAREINLLLGRTDQRLWQPESFDHWVRNAQEYERIISYIDQNPVKANRAQRRKNGSTAQSERISNPP